MRVKKFKKFFSIILVLTLLFSISSVSFADITMGGFTNKKVLMTEEVAIDMAQRFAGTIAPDVDILASNPIKFFDNMGQAIGYIVEYSCGDVPYGYIIYDTTSPALISEYSIGENSISPQAKIADSNPSAYSRADKNSMLYRLDGLTFGVQIANDELLTNSGDTIAVKTLKSARSKDPTTWSQIFIDPSEISTKYTVTDIGHVPSFNAYTEDYVESQTQHYACAVSALMVCAGFYGCTDWNNFREDYLAMWSATNTTTVSHENGITYGSTTDSNGTNGFISFCGSRGVPLSAGITNSPRMSFFKNCINGGNIGTIACRINVEHNGNIEVEGHLMAVQGYTQLKNVNTNQTIETVMVADGWNNDVRYVNLDFPYYVNSVGTIFAR